MGSFDPLAALEGGLQVPEPWTPPRVYTARELCEEPDPDIPVLLGSERRSPLLRRGDRVVVGGSTGAGKTTFCVRMIRAVVMQERFLEWRGQIENGRALVIDLEQGRRSIKRSLRQAGLDECEGLDYAPIPGGLNIDRDPIQREWLGEQLSQGYDVVMFDPLYKLHDADENDSRAMNALMKIIDGWRSEYGFALLLPAHLRKADKTGRQEISIDDIAGSRVIVNGAEVVLGLELVSGIPEGTDAFGKSRLHFWKDRDMDLPVHSSWMLNFKPDPVGFTKDEESGMTTAQLIVRRLSDAYPAGYSAEGLGKLLGVSKRTIQRHIADIRKAGNVEIVERLTPNGKKVYMLMEVVDDEELARWEQDALPLEDDDTLEAA